MSIQASIIKLVIAIGLLAFSVASARKYSHALPDNQLHPVLRIGEVEFVRPQQNGMARVIFALDTALQTFTAHQKEMKKIEPFSLVKRPVYEVFAFAAFLRLYARR